MSDYWHDQYYKLEEEHIKLHAALEASQREAEELRSIVKEFVEGLNPFSRYEYADKIFYEGKHHASTVKSATKALARTEKEGGG